MIWSAALTDTGENTVAQHLHYDQAISPFTELFLSCFGCGLCGTGVCLLSNSICYYLRSYSTVFLFPLPQLTLRPVFHKNGIRLHVLVSCCDALRHWAGIVSVAHTVLTFNDFGHQESMLAHSNPHNSLCCDTSCGLMWCSYHIRVTIITSFFKSSSQL